MSTPEAIKREAIVKGLKALGLHAGDGVVVHSSLKSFGRVDGGPLTVIAALMEVLTPDGTLVMPTFNHGQPFEAEGPGVYNPLVTPTINGAIPDTFWRMPGVLRSLDPTHPFAAWGKNAQRYIEFHHRTLTMGPESPLGLLGQDGGMILLMGTSYQTNTYHHVVEMTRQVPCLGQRTEAYPVRLSDGRTVTGRTWGWRGECCPITDTAIYQDEIARLSLERIAMIGTCHATLLNMSDCFAVVSRLLANGYRGQPPCSRCPIRPRQSPFTVESDWDAKHNCLKKDSEAWTY